MSTLMTTVRSAWAAFETPAATVSAAVWTSVWTSVPAAISTPFGTACTSATIAAAVSTTIAITPATLWALEARTRITADTRGIPANKFLARSVGITRLAGFPGQQDHIVFNNRRFGALAFPGTFRGAGSELLGLVMLDGFVVG
jgi:hypothetical protein